MFVFCVCRKPFCVCRNTFCICRKFPVFSEKLSKALIIPFCDIRNTFCDCRNTFCICRKFSAFAEYLSAFAENCMLFHCFSTAKKKPSCQSKRALGFRQPLFMVKQVPVEVQDPLLRHRAGLANHNAHPT